MRISLFVDVVDVVQRRALHRDAADLHGLEHGVGIERSGAPDGDDDIEQLRARLARLELERDRPARIARHDAEPFLQREIVDLDDDAVDLVIELVAPLLPVVRQYAITSSMRRARATFGFTGKPSASRRAQRLPLRALQRPCAANRDELIGEKREPALRGQRGSSWRTPPDAALRGLAKTGRPFAFARRVEPLRNRSCADRLRRAPRRNRRRSRCASAAESS